MMTPLFISSKSLFWDSARSALLTFLFGVVNQSAFRPRSPRV